MEDVDRDARQFLARTDGCKGKKGKQTRLKTERDINRSKIQTVQQSRHRFMELARPKDIETTQAAWPAIQVAFDELADNENSSQKQQQA